MRVVTAYVSSLKDNEAAACLTEVIADTKPDVVLNSTAFAARMDRARSPLEAADAPILQMIHSSAPRASWIKDMRGLGASDLAMNVVLPELDGRIITRAISFKEETQRSEALQFTRLVHTPDEFAHSLRRRSCRRVGALAAAAAQRSPSRLYLVGLSRESGSGGLCRRPRHAAKPPGNCCTAPGGGF